MESNVGGAMHLSPIQDCIPLSIDMLIVSYELSSVFMNYQSSMSFCIYHPIN